MLHHDVARRIVVIAMIFSILAAGCVRTREYKVARYEAGAHSLQQTIPRDGWYMVKWKLRDDEYRGIEHTVRYLTVGTPVGFETDDAGHVVALVGNERLAVGAMHRKARYCCWYQRTKEPTQFAIEMREALAGAGEVATVVFVGGAVVGGAALLWLDSDNDCDRPRYETRDRR